MMMPPASDLQVSSGKVQKKMNTVDNLIEEVNVAETLGKKDPKSANIDRDSLFLLVYW